MSHIYDLIIIGSGPAGLAAAVYAQRAKLDTLVVEKAMVSGGQVLTTYEVDNYPGLPGIGGYDLGVKFRGHADRLGARFVEDEVLNIQDGGKGAIKGVVCQGNTYEARSLILATGAVHRKVGVPGEEELAGAGVSYCATCDGMRYRDKTVVVVGGGNSAAADALYLAKICKKVYLVHRRDSLRASKIYMDPLIDSGIEFVWNSRVTEIHGDKKVTGVTVAVRRRRFPVRPYSLQSAGFLIRSCSGARSTSMGLVTS